MTSTRARENPDPVARQPSHVLLIIGMTIHATSDFATCWWSTQTPSHWGWALAPMGTRIWRSSPPWSQA